MYALNTRNEEQESLVTELRSTYEARAVEAESRTAARLREMRERVREACEEGERELAAGRKRLEEEREQIKLSEVREQSCKPHRMEMRVLCIYVQRNLARKKSRS